MVKKTGAIGGYVSPHYGKTFLKNKPRLYALESADLIVKAWVQSLEIFGHNVPPIILKQIEMFVDMTLRQECSCTLEPPLDGFCNEKLRGKRGPPRKYEFSKCAAKDIECDRDARVGGYCRRCYARLYQQERRIKREGFCSAITSGANKLHCRKIAIKEGMCMSHYVKAHQEPPPSENLVKPIEL